MLAIGRSPEEILDQIKMVGVNNILSARSAGKRSVRKEGQLNKFSED
jgi:hypothetical protein